ncbi:MAG: hypothetical protein HW421_3469 [Ignavibacteria bacterium]|nr:hypothetical protein [Ignavibacteria bacterium]
MKFIKEKSYFIFTIAVFTLIMYLSSCSETITSSKDVVFPDSNIAFHGYVEPFLNVTCAYRGCHSNEDKAGGIRLTDYYGLYDGAAALGLVVPGKPDGSRLVQYLEGKLPHTYSQDWKVTDNHKKGIRQWIKEGALEFPKK